MSTDVVTRLASVSDDGSKVAAAVALRSDVFAMTQAAHDAALKPNDAGGFTHAERAALATRIAKLNGCAELTEHYSELLATYDTDAPPEPLHNLKYLMGRRAKMEGFNTLDHWARLGEAHAALSQQLASGSLKRRNDIVTGLANAPEALVRVFRGDHLGKLVVKVAPDAPL